MPTQTDLSIIDLSNSTPRFEHITMPNGTTYKVGLSLAEQEAIVSAISELNTDVSDIDLTVSTSLNDLNSRIEELVQENESLRTELSNLRQIVEGNTSNSDSQSS
jgi:capsule polysaccharide export protein KpsE/RkpR